MKDQMTQQEVEASLDQLGEAERRELEEPMTQSATILTRRGVCKQLKYSPYTFTYFHNGKFVHLAFSSKLHLEKFVELREKNHAMIYNNINKRFKFKVDCTFLSDFNLYQKVENRGCYINFGGTIYKSIDDITID